MESIGVLNGTQLRHWTTLNVKLQGKFPILGESIGFHPQSPKLELRCNLHFNLGVKFEAHSVVSV